MESQENSDRRWSWYIHPETTRWPHQQLYKWGDPRETHVPRTSKSTGPSKTNMELKGHFAAKTWFLRFILDFGSVPLKREMILSFWGLGLFFKGLWVFKGRVFYRFDSDSKAQKQPDLLFNVGWRRMMEVNIPVLWGQFSGIGNLFPPRLLHANCPGPDRRRKLHPWRPTWLAGTSPNF